MKRVVLLLFLTVSLFSYGQTREFSEITFYGVDFSRVKVYGAGESPAQFKRAFHDINGLFISEPKKYNVAKFLDVGVREVSLDAVDKQNDKIVESGLIITGNDYQVTDEVIGEIVKELQIDPPHESVGVVLIAELLDKTENRGYYKVVYFDVATREIYNIIKGSGKSKGFGLRNFWAASVYNTLKKLK